MVDVWPPSLPQRVLVDGFSEGLGDGRLRSSMDTGPAKVRRRSSAMPRPLQGRVLMTDAQLSDMQTFVGETLLNGSLPFMFPDPITRAMILVRFSGSLPVWGARGPDAYDVALDLEVLP